MMKITKAKIKEYAKIFDERYGKDYVEKEMKDWLKNNRYLDREGFIKIGMWKSPRPKKHYKNNDDLTVKRITRHSFATDSEKERIECLLDLNGVGYPVASTILHFAFPDRYPIMDFRAIWSLGLKQPKYYCFDFWQKYCAEIKAISERVGENIRTIDKALWQYSVKNQRKSNSRNSEQAVCSPA